MDKPVDIKIKVCGMRDADNIRAVESLGIDLMGFIFYPQSPRYVSTVPDYLPTHCHRVGVFVDTSLPDILARVETFALDTVQLHGREKRELCLALQAEGLKVVKALPIATTEDLNASIPYEGAADCFLFDTACAGHGGSGRRFDWNILKGYTGSTPFLLSGGISPASLDDLLHLYHPMWAGIDLNSGFETSPGSKDVTSLKTFIHNLKNKPL